MRAAAILLAATLVFAARTSDAQAPPRTRVAPVVLPFSVRVAPETVTVGERFRVTASVWLPPGSWLELDPPAPTERVMAVDSPRTARPDSAASVFHASVEMVAWSPGPADVAVATARVIDPDGTTRMSPVALELPVIRSVLPADTTQHRPKGPKDVFDAGRPWWMTALLALLALLALALLVLALVRLVRWLRRRSRAPEVPLTARARALAALERARSSGDAEAGRWKALYSAVSDALRGYAAAVDARWSADLTTSELLARMRAGGVSEGDVGTLARVLGAADLAKFARRPFTTETAHADLAAARAWVERVGHDSTVDRDPAAAAAAGAGAGEGR